MIHRLFSFLLVAVASHVSAAEPLPINTFRRLAAGEKQTVVVYGTSLTAGGAWAQAMKKWFDEQYPGQVKFINSGGPGQNSDWGRANLKAKVLDHRPHFVLIEFSYNDAHSKFKMPVKKGAENLAAIVQEIRKQDESTDVVLQTMNVPWDPDGGRQPLRSRPELEAFNDNYRDFAKRGSLPLIDHYQAWKKLEQDDAAKYHKWLPDGSHPTAEASLAVTWPAIKVMLEQAREAAKTK